MRPFERTATRVFLSFLVLSMLPVTPASASTPNPWPSERPEPARRIASRALQRSTSIEWPSDIAERLRLLEEHVERAARERTGTTTMRTPR